MTDNANAYHRRPKKSANHTKARVVVNPWDVTTPANINNSTFDVSGGSGLPVSSVLPLEKIIEKFMSDDKSNGKTTTGKKANNIASATNQFESLGAVGGVAVEDLQFLVSSSSGAVRKRPRSNTGEVSGPSTVTSSDSSSVDTFINRENQNNSTPSHMTVPDPSPNHGEDNVTAVNPAQCMKELSNKLRTWQESLSSTEAAEPSSNEATFVVRSPNTSGSLENNLNDAVNTTVCLEAGNSRQTLNVMSEEESGSSPVASSSTAIKPSSSNLSGSASSAVAKNVATAATGAETGESGQEEEVDTDGRGYEQDDEDEEDDEDEIRFAEEGEQGL
jgi:hypothetical protein